MLKNLLKSPLSTILVILVSIIYSSYWLFLSSDIFWRNAVGVYNIVYLCFFIVLAIIAVLCLAQGNTKSYTIFSFIAFIPGVIACFLNRFARYPDFYSMSTQYIADNQFDSVSSYVSAMYDTEWKLYEYIISRSGKSSSVLAVLIIVWFGLLMYPNIKKED